MKSDKIYIGGFTYELGENRHKLDDLEELKGSPDQVTTFRNNGFENYHTSDMTVLTLAGKAVSKALNKVPVSPETIDAAIFATSSFGMDNHLKHEDICHFLLDQGLVNAYPMTSSLSFCGNFLPALKKAVSYLVSNDFNNILVVVTDIIPKGTSKLTPPDIAVGSDGASCCILSKEKISDFIISDINQAVNAELGLLNPDKDFLKYSSGVSKGIKETVVKTLVSSATEISTITKVFTNNYSDNVCNGFLRLLGIPVTKLYSKNISRFGHAGAADICINFSDYQESTERANKETYLLLSTGPFMWGSALIQFIQN